MSESPNVQQWQPDMDPANGSRFRSACSWYDQHPDHQFWAGDWRDSLPQAEDDGTAHNNALHGGASKSHIEFIP